MEEFNWYSVEAVKHYEPGERYNNGAGGSLSTANGSDAMATYHAFAAREDYAVEVRKDGVLLAKSGPSIEDAKRSSGRAWRERYRAKEVA